ncbi:MAG: DUF3419 family protein [Bacilli bacterium]|nr:DUF3419 family protein [Bacilli bacterium]
MNVNDNLNNLSKTINSNEVDEYLYNRVYSFSTENISGYIDYFDLKNRSLLTVGSSGDQILNSYLNGARDITLLDVNRYAPYYIYLKIAGILSLTYQEFQDFFFINDNNERNYRRNDKRFNKHLFNKLSNNLKEINYDSYYFFNTVFNKYDKEIIYKYLFLDDAPDTKVIKRINNYLVNEVNYNKLKKIIKDIGFKFINHDIFKYESDNKYDNIFLSNLCTLDNMNLYDYKDLLIKLKKNNLNINGAMLIVYIWNMQYDSEEINFEWKHVYNMPSTRSFLRDYITEHYNITGISDIRFDTGRTSDLVLIYKNRN